MEIEKQVCSLHIAQELKSLGIYQISLFYYCSRLTGYHNELDTKLYINKETKIDEIGKWSAFTASELFEILPARIDTGKDEPYNHFRLSMTRNLICLDNNPDNPSMVFSFQYECDTAGEKTAWFFNKLLPHNIWDESLPNALAKTIIELHKLGYLHPGKMG